jgi:coatomer subunit beta'
VHAGAAARGQHNRIARFLEQQGFPHEALQVATDSEHRFELAVQLGKLDVTHALCLEGDSDAKWRQLSDMALKASALPLAEEAMTRAADYAGLLMLHSSAADGAKMDALAEAAEVRARARVGGALLRCRRSRGRARAWG